MPLDKNDAAYLWDMLEAARGVVRSAENLTFKEYRVDENLRLAIERRIEIIGEAAGCVSQAVQQAHPGIPWRRIIAQRHVLAHEYGEIDDELIWTRNTCRCSSGVRRHAALIRYPVVTGSHRPRSRW